MSNPEDIRIPQSGEGWRHYKGGYQSLYCIVGVGHDENGDVVVVYQPYGWTLAQPTPLYTRKLGTFLQVLDCSVQRVDEPVRKVQRFVFEREAVT